MTIRLFMSRKNRAIKNILVTVNACHYIYKSDGIRFVRDVFLLFEKKAEMIKTKGIAGRPRTCGNNNEFFRLQFMLFLLLYLEQLEDLAEIDKTIKR